MIRNHCKTLAKLVLKVKLAHFVKNIYFPFVNVLIFPIFNLIQTLSLLSFISSAHIGYEILKAASNENRLEIVTDA